MPSGASDGLDALFAKVKPTGNFILCWGRSYTSMTVTAPVGRGGKSVASASKDRKSASSASEHRGKIVVRRT